MLTLKTNFWPTWLEPLKQRLSDVALLAIRGWLAQEFLYAGWTKLSGGLTPPEWFTELMFPFPHNLLAVQLNWVIAGGAELLFGVLLLIGFITRFAALSLVYITYVAIYTVHFDLGWRGWNQIETETGLGFKVPLMMLLMLFLLVAQGAGRLSVDRFFGRRR